MEFKEQRFTRFAYTNYRATLLRKDEVPTHKLSEEEKRTLETVILEPYKKHI